MAQVDVATLFFGIFIGIFIFTFAKAVQQTRSIWRHTHTLNNTYVYLIWGEMIANIAFSISTFMFIVGAIAGATWYYILAVLLWSVQVELLPQIIANRVALIMTNKRKAKFLKWGLAAIITPICLAVCYIWTVAHAGTPTDSQKEVNVIFEKVEKSFFLIVDLSLNLYFLYLVRFSLIANGLNKYWKLFNFNMGMVMISTALDILLLGFLSLENQFIYVQFAPLAYTAKLYIELIMARLISKVVRMSSNDRNDGALSSSKDKSMGGTRITSHAAANGPNGAKRGDMIMSRLGGKSKTTTVREGSNGSDIHLNTYEPHAITKTIETTFVVDEAEDSNSDRAYNEHNNRAFDGPDRTYKPNV